MRGKNKMKYFLAGEKMNLVQKYTPANFPILLIQQGYINKQKKYLLLWSCKSVYNEVKIGEVF